VGRPALVGEALQHPSRKDRIKGPLHIDRENREGTSILKSTLHPVREI
jgi:hypothetical protein